MEISTKAYILTASSVHIRRISADAVRTSTAIKIRRAPHMHLRLEIDAATSEARLIIDQERDCLLSVISVTLCVLQFIAIMVLSY